MSSQSSPVVDLRNITIQYGRENDIVHVVDNVNLQIEAGASLSITGASGSGKSSLLMLMSGLERPTHGSVVVAGQDLGQLDEDQLALFRQKYVGIVFQSFHLLPTMTALENVAIALEFAGVPDAFERARAELITLGLGERLDHYPAQLSGGEQQRVAIARALVMRPALLLADEPTGNLDSDTATDIAALLFQLQVERGTTLVLITHDEALAMRAQRRVRIHNHKLEELRSAH